MAPRAARQMEAELTGKSSARTDLQWTAFSSASVAQEAEEEECDRQPQQPVHKHQELVVEDLQAKEEPG